MRDWKRGIALFLALCLVVTTCPVGYVVEATGTSGVVGIEGEGFTVTLNGNGGNLGETTSIEVESGATFDSSSLPKDVTKSYYTFEGWAESSSSTIVMIDTELNAINKGTTLYAIWEIDSSKVYTITFQPGDNGTGTSEAKTTVEGKVASFPTFTAGEGYKFVEWLDEANGKVTEDTEFSKNTTVTAQWTVVVDPETPGTDEEDTDTEVGVDKAAVYSHVDTDGKTISETLTMTSSIKLTYFSSKDEYKVTSVELKGETSGNYTFQGFYDKSSGGTQLAAGVTFSSDTVYAVWEKDESTGGDGSSTTSFNVTIKYVTTDKSELTTKSTSQNIKFNKLTSGDAVTFTLVEMPANLTMAGFKFNGFYVEETLKTKVTESTVFDGTPTIYASWTESKDIEVTINMDLCDGVWATTPTGMKKNSDGTYTGTFTSYAAFVEQALKWPNPTRENYKFVTFVMDPDADDSKDEEIDFTVEWELDDGIKSLTMYSKPDTLSYDAGDKIDPDGLELKIIYDNGTIEYVAYDEDTEDDFSFSPGLSTSLTTTHSTLYVTYGERTVTCAITVADDDVEVSVNVEDHDGDEVLNAVAKLYQGTVTKYTATNKGDGSYVFGSVAPGDYNLIVTYGNHVRTFLVNVSTKDIEIDCELTEFAVATKIETDLDFDVLTVDGLDELALSLEGEEGETITVSMNFDDYVSATEKDFIMLHKDSDEIIAQIFDVSLSKIVTYDNKSGTDSTALSEISTLVSFTFQMDEDYEDRSSYFVYRKHGDVVEKLTTSKNSAGEYISVNTTDKTVTVYSKNYSTYALVVNAEDGEEDGEYSGNIKELTLKKTMNHSATTSDIPGTVEADTLYPTYGNRVFFDVKANQYYTVAGIEAVDSEGNKLVVLEFSEDRYYFTQLQNPVEVTVHFIGTNPATAPSTYTGYLDVSNTAYYFYHVYRCRELSLMTGTGNGLFQPDKVTTRAEVASILYSLAGNKPFYTENIFSDVTEGAWYYNAVLWAKSVSVISGYEDGTFRPDGQVTREEIAAMFYAYAKYAGLNTNTAFVAGYNDMNSVASWATAAVNWCTYRGLFSGSDGNLFAPSATSRRCDVSISLLQLYNLL